MDWIEPTLKPTSLKINFELRHIFKSRNARVFVDQGMQVVSLNLRQENEPVCITID